MALITYIYTYTCVRASFRGGAGGHLPPLEKSLPPLEICGFISLTKGKSVRMIYKSAFESFVKIQKHNSYMYLNRNFSRLPLLYFNNAFKVIIISGISSSSSSDYLRCYLRATKIKNERGGECHTPLRTYVAHLPPLFFLYHLPPFTLFLKETCVQE